VWYAFCKFWARLLFSVLFGIRVYGQRNVPATGGVILASTHQSFLDPIAVELGLSREGHIMARDSLFRGLFGRLISSLNAFPIERASADLGAMRTAIRRLSEGQMLLLFPEATRTRTGDIGRLRPGLGLLAKWSDATVVPVTIEGAFACWPRNRKMFRPGKIRVMFGSPMRLTSGKRRDLRAFIDVLRARMVAQQHRLRDIARLGV